MSGAVLPAVKDRAKTVPTLRTSGGTSVNNGTDSITVTIDSTAQAGDWALIAVASKSQAAPTTPTGLTWEHSTQIGDSASQPFIHLYSRRLVSNDVSTDLGVGFTFAFAASSTDGITGGYQVFANTSGFGIRPTSTFLSQTDTVNSHGHAPCSLQMGPSDLYAGVAAVLAYVSAGTANALLTTPPSGCTISSGTNVTALRAGGTGGTCRGQAMWTGPTHAARVESLTYPAQEWTTSVVFTLAPDPPHLVETDQGPPSLRGLEVYNYSNSSGACVVYSQGDATRGCNTYRPWPERVAQAFQVPNPHLADGTPKSNNMAMGGARAADICTAAYGTFSYTSIRAGSGNSAGQTNQYNPQVVTNSALPNRSSIGLYTMDLVGNDFLKLGTDDPTMAGAYNASEALVRLCRSASQKNVSDASQSYTGTWTDVSDTGYMGGAAKKTTVPGSKVSIALTSVDAIDLVLIAYDDTAIGAAGSTFTVKVDGVTVPTAYNLNLTSPTRTVSVKGTTSNQHQNSGAYKNYKYCQMTVSLTGIGAGSHTVTVEHAGSSGNEFVYNGYLIPATTPPWITMNCIWHFPDATYTGSPYSFASAAVGKQTSDWFDQITKAVAALFTDNRVLVYDPSASGKWDTSVHVSVGDSLHQSDLGHGLYAHEIIRMLNERMVSPYVAPTNPTQLMPTTVPATITMPGTRSWTVTAGNNTFAIECEGGAGAGGGGGVGLQGRGGGGGAYAKKNSFTYTVGSVLTETCGTGGVGSAGANGTSGTASQVVYTSGPDFTAGTVLCKADFGTGGQASTGTVGQGGLVANCVGDVKTAGSNASTTTGGAGAAPLGGSGGTVGGNPGSTYGGGGGGGNAGTANAGGPGAQGVVKFT